MDSGVSGNIVIYGQIECADGITLKDGQNLVGVGYFGDFDRDIDKFSQLSIGNNSSGTSITIKNNTTISDLEIFLQLSAPGQDNWGIKTVGKALIKNVNLDVSVSQDKMNYVAAIESAVEGNLEIDGYLNISMTGGNNETSGIFTYGKDAVTTISSGANVNIYGVKSALWNHSNKTSGSKTFVESGAKISTNAQHILSNGVKYDGYPAGSIQIDSGVKIALLNDKQIKWYELVEDFVNVNESTTSPFRIKAQNISDNLILKDSNLWKIFAGDDDKLPGQTAKQYKQIVGEYDKLIGDSSYQGVNLLSGGEVDVTFNETWSHRFTVAGQDMSAQALGITTFDWQTQGDIAQSLGEIAAALNSIRDFQTELGNNYSIIQTRQSFTEALADVLETGADDLILADMNEASAEYLTLQTRQYLAVNALSLAAQSSRGILRLF